MSLLPADEPTGARLAPLPGEFLEPATCRVASIEIERKLTVSLWLKRTLLFALSDIYLECLLSSGVFLLKCPNACLGFLNHFDAIMYK